MTLPTWRDLIDYHCTSTRLLNKAPQDEMSLNPYYEDFSCRRFNYSASDDEERVRLVFSKEVLSDKRNKTLCRNGRFVWCKDLLYEGKDTSGFRTISFSVDKGTKKFVASENNILSLPSRAYVSNNRFFRTKDQTFFPFSSVFGYKKCVEMMARNKGISLETLVKEIERDNPFRSGGLVAPRLGYFYPDYRKQGKGVLTSEHPYGVVLGRSLCSPGDYLGKEFYRVRFGSTTYEKVHPVQMEIINEV